MEASGFWKLVASGSIYKNNQVLHKFTKGVETTRTSSSASNMKEVSQETLDRETYMEVRDIDTWDRSVRAPPRAHPSLSHRLARVDRGRSGRGPLAGLRQGLGVVQVPEG